MEEYTLIKIPLKDIIENNYSVLADKKTETEKEYLTRLGNSLLFDQIEMLRGHFSQHISEVILVAAKKEPKQEKSLRHILEYGFTYNNIHYSRFGKSASQGKSGITAFVCDEMFDRLYKISQMDIQVDNLVISKYEAQRCLIFSTCTLIKDYLPNIVIVGEYHKTLYNNLIRYVVERERTFTDTETGETKTYNAREIQEGYRDIELSPFDGCGCHEKEFMDKLSQCLDLDYSPAGCQVRMPFMKGYSVYVPFRQILKSWGYEYIKDIYGHFHHIDTIDCIWNTSMFKGHGLFSNKYGENAWTQYINTFKKYNFKLGISKYSHHVRHLNKKTRMNFQYLQCLDLWNPKYIDYYQNGQTGNYDILSDKNQGKIISIAKYTTDLFEKIIKGDKFYTYKFMGITDTDTYEPESKYIEAVLANDEMLRDPAIKQFIYRKLKKSINNAKLGKIYADGFYHTVVGDMIGYLEYAAGKEPSGCLKSGEFFCKTLKEGDCLSFRSPLVCPSEINKVRLVSNSITDKWFSYFNNQDIVMLNMYDLSAPQQGGMDYDGDIVFLCNDATIVNAKIEKPIVIDIDDKASTIASPYTKENLINYEVMTRDNRIGEITNAATSIENKYTTNIEIQTLYGDYASLLRVFQGKEIDFLKTGLRWQMNNGLRKHLKQIPYFLLFNYPKKLKAYETLKEKNKKIENPQNKYPLNAYHSPSPMNELCDYICTWEKKHILWDHTSCNLPQIKALVTRSGADLSDRMAIRAVRHAINDYAADIRNHINTEKDKTDQQKYSFNRNELAVKYKEELSRQLNLKDEIIADYVISVSYGNLSTSKALCWAAYGDYILKNLRHNSASKKPISITEVCEKTDTSLEYLGKHYEFRKDDDL